MESHVIYPRPFQRTLPASLQICIRFPSFVVFKGDGVPTLLDLFMTFEVKQSGKNFFSRFYRILINVYRLTFLVRLSLSNSLRSDLLMVIRLIVLFWAIFMVNKIIEILETGKILYYYIR